MTEKIILVRHTEAEGGNHVFRGQVDADLLPEGVEHAKRLAKKFRDLHIDKIYSSMLTRSIKTARPIAKTHGLRIISSAEINEISFGIFDGMEREEVLKKYPQIYEQRGRDMMNFRIPGGGESYSDVRKRAAAFILSEAAKNRGETLMFVVHGSLMRSILFPMIKGKTWDELYGLIDYGSSIYLTHDKGKLTLDKIEEG